MKNMKNKHKNMATRSAGGLKMSRDFNLRQLEIALSREIALRRHLCYDDLIRSDGRSKVRAVRSEDGCIDILGTFLKVQKIDPVESQVGVL